MNPGRLDACFIEGRRGRLFTLLRGPTGGAAPFVLVAPPFGDEMNKSRKMVTDLAAALAGRGIATLVVDPYGTGDSEGEFRDADWTDWVEDLRAGVAWATAGGLRLHGLLGIRLGALLAAAIAAGLPQPVARTVFWQPQVDGQRFVTQFLRLRVAASLMEDRKETVGGLRERSRGGETLEVAGYELSPVLLAQLDMLRLDPEAAALLGRLTWLEVVRAAGDGLPATAQPVVESLRTRLAAVQADTAVGEPFWTSTEIVRIPALVERTVQAFAEAA